MLTLALVLLAQTESEYPKVVRRDGQVCIQALNAKGAVEESCRAEGSDVRTPLPSAERTFSSDRPLAAPAPVAQKPLVPPPTPSALYWAQSKQGWALAFKFVAVGAYLATAVSSVGALLAGGSGVPRAAEPYLASALVSGAGALIFTVVAYLFDRWGFHEIEPEVETEAE